MSLFKLQLQLKEAVRKLQEGVEFGTRGVRLMGSDVAGAARMFWRAALGTCNSVVCNGVGTDRVGVMVWCWGHDVVLDQRGGDGGVYADVECM